MSRTWGKGLFVGLVLAIGLFLWAHHRKGSIPVNSPAKPSAPNPLSSTQSETPPQNGNSASPQSNVQTNPATQARLRHVRELVSQMSPEEREEFEKKFTEKIKPAVEQWCRIYEGRLPFRPEDVTADKLKDRAFPDSPFQGYSFVVNGTTLGVCDDHGKICVDYLMSPAANDLFHMPKAPTSPQPMSVSRQEILDLIKADSGGKSFPPDQIAIRPTSASGAMNGGVSVDVGVGVNAPFMPLPKFGFVFDPEGKLACYIRGFDTPPHN